MGVQNEWVSPVESRNSLIGETHFDLLNVTGDVREIGWNGPERSLLWRYNQHYFDGLRSASSISRRVQLNKLIELWISGNPEGVGVGWDPYPLSLRLVNWCKYLLSGAEPGSAVLESMVTQTRWLSLRIEHHLQGNHLFANAKALYFVGCCLDTTYSAAWLTHSRRLLKRQLREQILSDGGHFELSPMYHAIALEDVLDLVNLARAYGRQEDADFWAEFVPGMLHWLERMSHGDGDIAFFNDAAFGVAPDNDQLFAYASRLGFDLPTGMRCPTHLTESGYVRLDNGEALLICDIGQVGPDYIPGHAHADTLSFELSVGSDRVFVNSGVSEYGESSERLRQRGTASHNTLMINNEDSSEVWSGFRVAKRARAFVQKVEFDAAVQRVTAFHNGYHRVPGKPTHSRTWTLTAASLTVEDTIEGEFISCFIFYHCHPGIQIEPLSLAFTDLLLHVSEKLVVRMRVDGASVSIQPATWHPQFGTVQENKKIMLEPKGGSCSVRLDLNFKQ